MQDEALVKRHARSLRITQIILLTGFAANAANLHSQSFAQRPIRLIVGSSAGGGGDGVARVTAAKLASALGQSVVVDNRPGAAGNIGTEIVARAAPDGYTLLFAAAPLALNNALGVKQPYDVLSDLVPISLVVTTPVIIAVNTASPYRKLKDIVDASRADSKGINYATAGVGSMPHLLGEAFRIKSTANLTHIGYKGSAPALQDVMGGSVPVMMDAYTPAGVQVAAGKLRGIAVASPKRLPSLPDVPTTGEEGYPDIVGEAFYGLLAPAGTPQAIIDKLHAATVAVVRDPEVRDRLTQQGYNLVAGTPAEYTAHMRREITRWTAIVKAAGIQP